MMHMFFWWGIDLDNFLFKGYNIHSVGSLIGTCILLAVVTIIYELIQLLRAKLRNRELRKQKQVLRQICPSGSRLGTSESAPQTSTEENKLVLILRDLFVWLTQETLGYMIMMAVMLYNGYMTIAVILGSGLGYFIFGPNLMKLNIENCNSKRSALCTTECAEADKTALLPTDDSANMSTPAECSHENSTVENVENSNTNQKIVIVEINTTS